MAEELQSNQYGDHDLLSTIYLTLIPSTYSHRQIRIIISQIVTSYWRDKLPRSEILSLLNPSHHWHARKKNQKRGVLVLPTWYDYEVLSTWC